MSLYTHEGHPHFVIGCTDDGDVVLAKLGELVTVPGEGFGNPPSRGVSDLDKVPKVKKKSEMKKSNGNDA